mgnify:CR=1 FL=1
MHFWTEKNVVIRFFAYTGYRETLSPIRRPQHSETPSPAPEEEEKENKTEKRAREAEEDEEKAAKKAKKEKKRKEREAAEVLSFTI